MLVKLGSGAALIGAMRAGRQVILPLWAVSIGIGSSQTALIIGIAGAIDFALFYTSGQIMDRCGRMWSALPCMVGLGLSYLVLSLTHELMPTSVAWFIGVAMFMSVANGIGSGILMTLGADLADKAQPRAVPRRVALHRRLRERGRAAADLRRSRRSCRSRSPAA